MTRIRLAPVAVLSGFLLAACSSSSGSHLGTGGSSGGTGGSGTGGSRASGGSGGSSSTGGQTGAGGTASGTGGATTGSGGATLGTGGTAPGTGGTMSGTGGTTAGTGGSPATGGVGGSASGGSSGSAGSSGGSSGATGGSGGVTPIRSAGCGKTSTLTFGTVPGETANATPGSPSLGTGKGGYVNITSGGQQRGFAMRLPDNYDNNHPYWLVFAFHWNGGTSKDQDTGGDNGYFTAYYGLQRKSNNGAIFVAPDSIGSGWGNGNDSDLHFTDDMVKLITDNYCVDMSNLVTSGFSWGGGMSYELACARANSQTDSVGYAFRAAVIFEGAQLSGCDGGKDPIALWQKVGLTDTTCPVNLATPIRDQFVKNNQCTGWTSETGNVAASKTGTTSDEPPRPPNPGQYINPGGHVCTNYTGCSSGHPIRWCVDQSGHGNATTDGTSSLYDECANVTSQNPMGNCSPGCPCTWTPDDIWTWLNDPSTNKYTPNITSE